MYNAKQQLTTPSMSKTDRYMYKYKLNKNVKPSHAKAILDAEDDHVEDDHLESNQYSRSIKDSQGNTILRFC